MRERWCGCGEYPPGHYTTYATYVAHASAGPLVHYYSNNDKTRSYYNGTCVVVPPRTHLVLWDLQLDVVDGILQLVFHPTRLRTLLPLLHVELEQVRHGSGNAPSVGLGGVELPEEMPQKLLRVLLRTGAEVLVPLPDKAPKAKRVDEIFRFLLLHPHHAVPWDTRVPLCKKPRCQLAQL